MLGELDDAALDTILEHAAPGRAAAVRGAAPARRRAGARAGGRRRGRLARRRLRLLHRRPRARRRRWRRRSHAAGKRALAALAAYDTGSAYLNFAEEPTDASLFYSEVAYARLRRIRAAVDPRGLMVGNHPIPAA